MARETLPFAMTCAEINAIVMLCLRHGTPSGDGTFGSGAKPFERHHQVDL